MVRRVLTRRDDKQRSSVVDDVDITPITVAGLPGYAWHRVWSTERWDVNSAAGDDRPDSTHFPPPGGLRFNVFTVPPGSEGIGTDLSADAEAELERRLPGRARHMHTGQAGMHATETIDFVYVADGEITLELDDGDKVELRQGDCVVQDRAAHAWLNRGERPCILIICLVGVTA